MARIKDYLGVALIVAGFILAASGSMIALGSWIGGILLLVLQKEYRRTKNGVLKEQWFLDWERISP